MYSDANPSSNPDKNNMAWSVTRSLTMNNPGNQYYDLAPGETLSVFNGTRSTSIGSGTEFVLALWLDTTLYRMSWTGVGAAPVFRTDRGLVVDGVSLALTANSNGTLTVVGPGVTFASVVAGDTVFLPGPSTGDSATEFSTENEGFWTVLSASNTTLQLKRPNNETFVGLTETVVPTDNTQFIAFSASGVQVGDTIRLSAGFSDVSLKSYTISAVAPEWVEFYDSSSLPVTETAFPGVSGVTIYTKAKNFIYLEYDQECVAQLNGDTGTTNRLSPVVAGDEDWTGITVRFGPCWSLTVINTSQETLHLLVGGAEKA